MISKTPKIQIIKSILIFSLFNLIIVSKNIIVSQKLDQIPFDQYETNIFNNIKDKLKNTKCSKMWGNQREFINGIIRKRKPKKNFRIGCFIWWLFNYYIECNKRFKKFTFIFYRFGV
jgi:hypothetical protein